MFYTESFVHVFAKEESVTFGYFSVEHVPDDSESKLLIRHIIKVTNAKEVARLLKSSTD